MTQVGALIAAEIAARGPLEFSRFMELALYHPEHGYYRRGAKVFGREGDFYTAAQMQPVFGRLMARIFTQLDPQVKRDLVVDWGAGQSDLRESLDGFDYRAIDSGRDEAPVRFTGIVFANELFDALAVDVAQRKGGVWRERRVEFSDERLRWCTGPVLAGEWLEYAERAAAAAGWEEDAELELPTRLAGCVAEIDARLESGTVIALDYGYSDRELARFPNGTLMSYRRHQASEDVLDSPGERDITAHVPFEFLRQCAREAGWREVRFETMGQLLLRAGEADNFAAALQAASEAESMRLRLQLKSLLFDLGESFRAAVWEKGS